MDKRYFIFFIMLFSIQIFADSIWSGHISYVHPSNIIDRTDINKSEEQNESNSSVDKNLTAMFVWKCRD